jgi:hypothetical protein
MVSKCANPACKTEFKYFRDGKLSEFEHVGGRFAKPGRSSKAPKHHTLYWLCKRCSATYALSCSGSSVRVVPREDRQHRHVA